MHIGNGPKRHESPVNAFQLSLPLTPFPFPPPFMPEIHTRNRAITLSTGEQRGRNSGILDIIVQYHTSRRNFTYTLLSCDKRKSITYIVYTSWTLSPSLISADVINIPTQIARNSRHKRKMVVQHSSSPSHDIVTLSSKGRDHKNKV